MLLKLVFPLSGNHHSEMMLLLYVQHSLLTMTQNDNEEWLWKE